MKGFLFSGKRGRVSPQTMRPGQNPSLNQQGKEVEKSPSAMIIK